MLEGRKQDTSPASHLSVNPFPHPKHSIGAGFQGAALWLLTAALEEKLRLAVDWTGQRAGSGSQAPVLRVSGSQNSTWLRICSRLWVPTKPSV